MSHRYYETKDLSEKYKQYRPRPPQALIDRVMKYLREKYTGELELAVDVGCGTGQNTYFYADTFKRVIGTDVSQTQIDEANKDNTRANVKFEVSLAESLNVEDNSVQLLTAMTAVHWFDHPKFFAEGLRVLVPGGVMALYGYSGADLAWERNPARNATLKQAIDEYTFEGPVSPYWPEPFRKYVVHHCRNITIPYADFIRDDSYSCTRQVSLADVICGLQTWSVLAVYLAKEGKEAADQMLDSVKNKLLNIVKDDLKPSEDSPENIFFIEKTPYYLMLARKPSA